MLLSRARAWRFESLRHATGRGRVLAHRRAVLELRGSRSQGQARHGLLLFPQKNSGELQGTAPQAARLVLALVENNSRLAAWHSLCVKKETQGWGDYDMENKWAFIEKGRNKGVAVSPVLETPALCIKHKNEEGGMGIHFFRNALEGGDWILQEVMANEAFVASLLPEHAPLSTFRVMTASRLGLSSKENTIEAISCVFRAGRKGAATDHDSILFDVDVKTGKIGRGTTNMQWYRLGLRNCLIGGVRWAPPPDILDHPDCPGKRVTGAIVPDFQKRVAALATEAHRKLLPTVPLAGWDVVLSRDHGACLLEVNLSCSSGVHLMRRTSGTSEFIGLRPAGAPHASRRSLRDN